MFRTGITLLAALALVASSARADLVPEKDPEPDQLFLTYRATAGQHQISGVSHKLEWSVISLAGGSAKVRLRIPVASFQSGDAAVDEQLRETLEAAKFPFIDVEGTALVSAPVQFQGTVTIRGVTRPFAALLTLNRSGLQLAVSVAMRLDLDAFGIARPIVEASAANPTSARIEKMVELDFAALLSIQPRSVVSGGFLDSSLVTAE